MTSVVNIKHNKYDVYIGRGSPFGNPFQIGRDGDRKQVIEKYRVYFIKRLTDPKFRDKVMELKGKILNAINRGKGSWSNQSLYASSGAADFHLDGNKYLVEENFELIISIRKYAVGLDKKQHL